MTDEIMPSANANPGPRRKLSLWRVFVAFLIIGGLAWAGTKYTEEKLRERMDVATEKATPISPWFAAYVDATATPTYNFEQLGSSRANQVVLSFIVSASDDACSPSWGTYYSLDGAAVNLDLDRRIARLQQQGGRVAISFGGQKNSELAVGCDDADKLYQAYKSVIDRYNIDTVDIDLEGESLKDDTVLNRRAQVLSKLQADYRSQNRNLAIWLTLPVSPTGLTEDGTNTVAKTLAGGVDLSGINVMTMDFGGAREADQSMLDAVKASLVQSHRQLGILYDQAGVHLSSGTLWKKIGATPMIGQNDTINDVFSLDDAEKLNTFAREQGIGRMSMWSSNRDIPCGENYVDTKVVSPSCSGVGSAKSGFTQTLSDGFDGTFAQSAGILTIAEPDSNTQIVDNPDTSPYQIWQETGAYPKGVKVVWHGNVYEAKWWTKNDLPDNPVLQAWQTSWQLIGPVMPGERRISQPTLPKGAFPEWAGEKTYSGGDRVLFEGTPFQAKWWNQGESPAASAANPDSSPWIALTQAQINDIINELQNGKKN